MFLRTPYCIDCGSPDVKVHWGGGGRCQKCSDRFSAEVQAKRKREFEDECARKKLHAYKRDVDGHCPDDGEVCPDCCEHEFDWSEGGMCIICELQWEGA
jgi:hypothetical protein